jgi:hypothetical protein
MAEHHYKKFTSTNSREEAIERAHNAGYAVKNVTEIPFGNGVGWTAYAYLPSTKPLTISEKHISRILGKRGY